MGLKDSNESFKLTGLITKLEKKLNPCMNCDSINITLIDEQ